MLQRARVPCAGRVSWFEQIDSTNRWLLEQPDLHACVCLTEWQTAGRGSRGRSWQAAPSSSVLLSIGWHFAATAGLSLVSGLAVVNALGRVGVQSVGLKWPNDIIAGERNPRGSVANGVSLGAQKLGGVLTELKGTRGVVGMGINVTMLAVAASSARDGRVNLAALGHTIDRDLLAAELIISHCDYLQRFCEGGFGQFIAEWNELNVYRDQRVSVALPDEAFGGVVQGVDGSGALIIDQDGVQRRVISGQATVRALDS